MDEFVAEINHGREPRSRMHGRFLLAEGDELKPVLGLPQVPAAFLAKVRTQPSTARVVDVELLPGDDRQMCDKRYRLKLSIGGSGVLVAGEELEPAEPGNVLGKLTLESVDSNRAVGLAEIFEVECGKPEHVPDQGWVFSTGAYDLVAANQEIDEARARAAVK